MKKRLVLASTALLAVAGVALAQPAAPQRPDRNADVTRQQMLERVEARFARLDQNRDGRLTREEARQAGAERRQQMHARMFERMDQNRDGNISRAEFDSAHARMGQSGERRGPGMRGHRMGGHAMGGAGHGRRGPGERLFGEQGEVTLAQMRERAAARFDRLDANRDGRLTAAERQQARAERRQQRMERRRPAQ